MGKSEYVARCHCGNIRFSFRSEKIKNGFRCNCSICIRKGAIWSAYIPSEDFRPTQNEEQLSNYLWNDRVMNHFFCKNCGIHPYAGAREYGFRVNLGCVLHFDPLGLEISFIDGKSMEVCKDPGPHPGSPEPKETPNVYMVIEKFRNPDGKAVYRRFSEKGRMLPAGLRYVQSWVDVDRGRCYQIMECTSPSLLDEWAGCWGDLVEFEFIPVIGSQGAAQSLRSL